MVNEYSLYDYNPKADVNPPTKKQERYQAIFERYRKEVNEKNEYIKIQNEKLSHSKFSLYCSMCKANTPLLKRKPTKVKVGYQSLELPTYRCETCRIYYHGFPPDIHHEVDESIKAILVVRGN